MKERGKKGVKWLEIFERLQEKVRSGAYPAGVPLPSEEALKRQYGVSRITAVRAIEELRMRGLVFRKRGKGTFSTASARAESGRLGLIVPDLSFGEIFPPVCQMLVRFAQADGYSFVLGEISSKRPVERAHEACRVARLFVEQRVAGVVIQPLAFLRRPERVTREILTFFDEAHIPVVLFDRDIAQTAMPHDFVGIDNVAAGRVIGEHLLSRGARKVMFLMRPKCATIIRDRVDGVMSALSGTRGACSVVVAEPDDMTALASFFRRRSHPDAVVCESDEVAVHLRNTLHRLGLEVPKDVMLAGFDDRRCAVSTIPPLTTVHQPCEDIARIVYATLRERMRDATLPQRRILLPAPLIVRESTGDR